MSYKVDPATGEPVLFPDATPFDPTTLIARFKFRQTVTPAPNGVIVQFTIAEAIVPGTLCVYRSGERLSDVTEDSATQFTVSEAPLAVESLRVDYIAAI